MSLMFNCGFSKVAVKESFHKTGTTMKEADPVQRLRNCHACQVHHFAFQSLFPNTVRFKPQKLIQEAFVENGNVGNNKVKPTQKAITTAAKHIYLKINGHFQKTFNVSFAEAQTKVSELELQQKKSKIQKKRERRQRARQEKNKVLEEWSKRDADTMLSTRQSASKTKDHSAL